MRYLPVINARAGNPIMSERSIVDDSFDVGIIIEVEDEEGLQEYLDHPIHQKAKKRFSFHSGTHTGLRFFAR